MNEATDLRNIQKKLVAQVADLERQLSEARKDLAAVNRSLELLNPSPNSSAAVEHRPDLGVEIEEIQGQEILDALLLIARKNNGVLRTRQARKLLQQAELLPAGPRSSNILWKAIVQSEMFEHVKQGEYRLREESWEPEDRERPA